MAAGTPLDSFDGIRQAQVSRDTYRLAAIAQKQLRHTGHDKPGMGYTSSLSHAQKCPYLQPAVVVAGAMATEVMAGGTAEESKGKGWELLDGRLWRREWLLHGAHPSLTADKQGSGML